MDGGPGSEVVPVAGRKDTTKTEMPASYVKQGTETLAAHSSFLEAPCTNLSSERRPAIATSHRRRSVICAILLAIAFSATGAVRAQTSQVPADVLPSSQTPTQSTSSSAAPQQSSQPQEQKPSLLTPLKHETELAPYVPINARQRLRWFITYTIGPSHLAGGTISSAFGTALDRPKEYGPSWGGFADRFGMRLTGVSTGNAMEATAGALWGEDPRYFREPRKSFGRRVRSVVAQTFLARHRDGNFAPAYARYIAVPGNNFLSNTWRVHSEANVHDAILRTGDGFAARMASNAFEEFWPDVKTHVFRKK